MNGTRRYDVAVIGGGIVGIATAHALCERLRGSLVVLEAESKLGGHQSGHNSGVIHSGLYYKPGSLKARNCVEGRDLMYRLCEEHGVPHERCGKVVVATRAAELPALDELERRGRANGLDGMRRLGPEQIRELEPHVAGHRRAARPADRHRRLPCASWRCSPTWCVPLAARFLLDARVERVRRGGGEIVIETRRGPVTCRALVNCAGLQLRSRRPALRRAAGTADRSLPRRVLRAPSRAPQPGAEPRLSGARSVLPVPRRPLHAHDPRRRRGGTERGAGVEARGLPAPRRLAARPRRSMAAYGGFWRMASRYWSTGMGEMYRSVSKRAFVTALRRLVPELREDDIERGGAGVRAQAVEPSGLLVDDFRIVEAEGMVHVLNAPSPGATASISIGRTIADIAARRFGPARGA